MNFVLAALKGNTVNSRKLEDPTSSPSYWLESGVFISFLLLFAGFFFMEKDAHRGIMYLSMPLYLYFLYSNRPWNHLRGAGPVISSAVLYLLVCGWSILWSPPTTVDQAFQSGKLLIFIPLVALAFFGILQCRPRAWVACKLAFIISAVFTGGALLVLNFELLVQVFDPVHRLQGFGRAENSIHCALLYGLAALALFFTTQHDHEIVRHPIVRAIGVLTLLLVVILTGSRGPLLALIIASIGTVFFRGNHVRAVVLGAGVASVLAAYVLSPMDFGGFKERGDTTRLGIWQQATEQIMNNPVLGNGVATEHIYSVPYGDSGEIIQSNHAHNLYLSVLFQVGLIGFAPFAFLTIALLLAARRMALDGSDIAPLAFLLFGLGLGLFDLSGYIVNLGSEWLVFWLPGAVVVKYISWSGYSERSRILSSELRNDSVKLTGVRNGG